MNRASTSTHQNPLRERSAGCDAPGPVGLKAMASNVLRLQRDAGSLFRDLQAEFGNVVRLPLANHLTFLNLDPAGVRHVLVSNNANYRRGAMYERFRIFFGDGILTTDGEPWRVARRRVNPAFHSSAVSLMAGHMTHATDRVLDRWHPYAQTGTALDVIPDVMHLSLLAMGNALFSTDLAPDSARLSPAMQVSLEAMIFKGTVDQQLPRRLPTPYNNRIRSAVSAIDQTVARIVVAHRERPTPVQPDIVDLFLQPADDGTLLTGREVRDQLVTVFMAGHETTGIGLGWAMLELAQHPQVQEQLQQEVDEVLGGNVPTAADSMRLPLTARVVDEVLRLHPPIWLFPRDAITDDLIGGYRIPARSSVFQVPLITHRLPEYWDAPDDFQPDRFNPAAAAARPRHAYLPFGAGQRQCLGNHMALMQLRFAIAMIMQRYRLSTASPEARRMATLVSLRPVNGIPLRIHHR